MLQLYFIKKIAGESILEEEKRVEECGGRWGVEGWGERESKSAWLLLSYVFFPLGLPSADWAQPGVLLCLKSSLQSSDLSLTFLCSIFEGFSLLCLLATTILDSFSLFYLPNTYIQSEVRKKITNTVYMC